MSIVDAAPMNVRDTVRILLFDPAKRLLLMRVVNTSLSDPSESQLSGKSLWVTIGGRLEEGEDLFTAARRELKEETGIVGESLESLGPPVWYGEQVLIIYGAQTLLRETFIVAKTTRTTLSSELQTPEEKEVIREMKWWTVDAVERSSEVILPKIMRRLVRDVADGRYPDSILHIDLSSEPAEI
jgi:8-oxo-dGTP pyrophosphatase MutT (NUDIX family)